VLFSGRLFAGRLFSTKLFGVEDEEEPQVDLPLEYHGGGGEDEIVRKVIEKWEAVERAREKRRRKYIVEVVPPDVAPEPTLPEENEAPATSEAQNFAQDANSDAQDIAQKAVERVVERAFGPLIQPTFRVVERPRFAPTGSTTATVVAPVKVPVDDEMDDVMVVLLALEEAGEI
jgi:hypothetical protein